MRWSVPFYAPDGCHRQTPQMPQHFVLIYFNKLKRCIKVNRLVTKVLNFEMLSTVFVIRRELGFEDGMRKNGKLEREQRGNRQD